MKKYINHTAEFYEKLASKHNLTATDIASYFREYTGKALDSSNIWVHLVRENYSAEMFRSITER